MDENDNVKDGIEIQMNEFHVEMMEEPVKEIAGGEPESLLEEGFGDYDLIGVWSRYLLTLCQPPLGDGAGRKKMVSY
jgi:hypothetical protein